jgi:hypothetical protein
MSDLIKQTRLMVSNLGGSELKAVSSNATLQKLFDQKQRLVSEMNQAKRKAADEAAVPYLKAIEEVDQTYSMILALIGNNKS